MQIMIIHFLPGYYCNDSGQSIYLLDVVSRHSWKYALSYVTDYYAEINVNETVTYVMIGEFSSGLVNDDHDMILYEVHKLKCDIGQNVTVYQKVNIDW
jgi:hypothetical protein